MPKSVLFLGRSRVKSHSIKAASAKKQVAKKKPSVATQRRATLPPSKATSDWAHEAILRKSKTIAWEGSISPLIATSIFPPDSPFLASLDCRQKDGAWHWHESIHPLDTARVKRFFEDIHAQFPGVDNIEYRLVDKQGSLIWVRHVVTSIQKQGASPTIQGVIIDIHSEKEYQLESLQVSEREQNRIGQDLHDDLCQVLAGLSCLTRVFEARMAGKIPEEVPTLKEINQQLVDAMHRTRALTHGLFPGKIQIADIRGALLELVGQIKARFQVEIRTQFVGRFPRHPDTQIIQIYRLAQEAISNAIKHGRATFIEIKLEARPDSMLLAIADNGSGLSKPDAVASGIGLHIMRYRAGILGGEFSIRNGSEKGVLVTLRYPFET